MFIPACMFNEKMTNFYILEQNSETPHVKKELWRPFKQNIRYNNLLPETHVDYT